MNLDKHENFPEKAEDWNRIANEISEEDIEEGVFCVVPGKDLILYDYIPEDLLFDNKLSLGAKVLYAVYHSYFRRDKNFMGRNT